VDKLSFDFYSFDLRYYNIQNQDFIYGLPVIWAFIGILIRHTSENGFEGKYPGIIILLIVIIILLLITDVYILVSDKEKLKSFKLLSD